MLDEKLTDEEIEDKLWRRKAQKEYYYYDMSYSDRLKLDKEIKELEELQNSRV